MPRRPRVWRLLAAPERWAVQQLARQAGIAEVVAQLLWQRGIRDVSAAQQFLQPKWNHLAPPSCLAGVVEAAQRLVQAIRNRRSICIYGDYDVDGIVGTAVLVRLLQHLGAAVQYHIPSRQEEGYGLNAERLRQLHHSGVQMVVTVDCGISGLSEAELAQQLGLELIITDHHALKFDEQGGVILPSAAVIVHPRWPMGHYPYGELCGAGVAFKLAWEIARQASGVDSGPLPEKLRELLLDAVALTAIAIVADAVPLRGENRVLLSYGLRRLIDQPPLGLKALLEVAQLTSRKGALTVDDLGYQLAPRLNAAGRIDCARISVDLLLASSYSQAKTQAEFLNKLNTQRREIESTILRQAREQAERDYNTDPALVLAQPGWHPGVIGIVAGRLVHEFAKPVVVIAIPPDGGIAVGSGRSVPDLAIHEAFRACEAYLEGHGGHACAAGLKIAPERIDAFRKALNQYVARYLPTGSGGPYLLLDAEVPLSAISLSLLHQLEQLEPCGLDNKRPCFLACDLAIEQPRVFGRDEPKKHLDFYVVQGGQRLRCVGWGMADRLPELQQAERICIAFQPQRNSYQGSERVELCLLDFQCTAMPKLG
jgi:single-stranded-DNA-specific exonuclease